MGCSGGGCSTCTQHLSERGYFTECRKTLKLALGMGLQCVSQVMLNPLSTAFAGHLGKVELDAVALANTIINVLGNSIVLGMSTSCDTYFTQAFGNNQLPLLGVVLQRSLVITTLLYLILCPFYLNMEQILLILGQDPEVAKLVGEYMLIFMPGMFFIFGSTVLKKYLACQNVIVPGVVIGFTSIAISAIFQYIFLYQLGLGVVGSALAMDISCFSLFLLLLLYIIVTKFYKASWRGWSWKMMENWWPFTKLGIYGIFMTCLEWWAFEIAVLLAGVLGTTELGAQGVFFNTEAIFIAFGIGIGDATGIRVGQALGQGDPDQACRAAKIGYAIAIMMSTVLSILIFLLRFELPKIYTNVPEVIELTSTLLPVLSFYIFFDNIASIGRGVTMGAGRQAVATIMIIVVYYFIGLPLGIPLMFETSLGVMGIWIGLSTAVTIAGVLFMIYTQCMLDWNSAAQEAYERVEAAKKSSIVDSKNDCATERKALLDSSTRPVCTETTRSSLSMSQHGSKALHEAEDDLEIHETKFELLKKRFVAFLVVLALVAAGICFRIFLPSTPLRMVPDPCTERNSTLVEVINGSHILCNNTDTSY